MKVFGRSFFKRLGRDTCGNVLMIAGAGTVLTAAQANAAVDAGAKFIVSPGLDDGVVATAKARGVPVLCWTVKSPAQEARARQVFDNLQAIAQAAGGSLNDAVKLTIFLTDLGNFATVNEVMAQAKNDMKA